MKHIGWLKILRSFLALLFFLLIYAHDRSFKTLLYSTSAGYIIPSVLFLALFLGKYFKLQLERNIISTLILYGFLNSVRALSATVYTYSDKILINKFLTLGDVGLYRIYYLSSLNLLSSLFVIFNTVFFPSASRERNKHLFLSKINRSVPLTFTFSFLISLLSEFAVFKFIGDEYTFDLKLSVIFAITSGIFVLARLYSWFLTSTGTAGAKISSTGEILTALSNILFNFILIPRLQISGAILSSLLSYLLLLAIVHPNKYPNLLR
jgi:O-antigen/teichoic acid export membrane protein